MKISRLISSPKALSLQADDGKSEDLVIASLFTPKSPSGPSIDIIYTAL